MALVLKEERLPQRGDFYVSSSFVPRPFQELCSEQPSQLTGIQEWLLLAKGVRSWTCADSVSFWDSLQFLLSLFCLNCTSGVSSVVGGGPRRIVSYRATGG